jgi:hypothetical protein
MVKNYEFNENSNKMLPILTNFTPFFKLTASHQQQLIGRSESPVKKVNAKSAAGDMLQLQQHALLNPC